MQTTAAGSTEREMGNIEESVSYKLNALKETWIGLLTDVSRTSLGNIVDMITAISEAITGLVENLGLVKTALGAASGLFLTKTGFGTNIDLKDLSNSSLFGLGKWWKSDAGTTTSVVKKNSKKKDSTNNTASATTVAVNKDLANSMEDIADSATNASSAMSDAKKSTDAFKNKAKETTSETKQLVVATEDLNEKSRNGSGEIPSGKESSLTNGQKLISNFKNVAKSVGSAALSFAVNWGASMLTETVISAAVTAIDNYVNRVQYAIEAGQEAQTQISSLSKELDDTVRSADEYSKTYTSLMGKASTTQKDGKTYYSQGSMTNDEWDSFIEANSQLAELMPQNVAYFDEQGNVMVNLGNSTSEVNSTLSEFIGLQSQIAGFEIGDNLATAVKGIFNANTEIEKENEKLSEQIEAAQAYSDWKSGVSGLEQGSNGEKYGVYSLAKGYNAPTNGRNNGYAYFSSSDVGTINGLIDAAEQAGIKYTTGITPLVDGTIEMTLELSHASQETLDAFNSAVGDSTYFNRKFVENQSQLSQNDLEVKANLQSLIPNFQAYGKSLANAIDFSFSDDIKNILVSGVSASIGNFDVSSQTTDQLREIWGENGENTSDWIYTNYVEPLTKLATYDSSVQNEVGNYIDSILNSDSDSLKNQTIDDYENMLSGVSSKLTDIMGGGDEAKSLADSLIKLSGISDIEDVFEQNRDKIVDTYGQDLFDKLETKGQMDIAINLIDDNVEGDTQEIYEKIQAQWNKSTNASNDHSIASLFSNQSDAGETFSDTVSSFQSDANTIDEALATLRTSGDVDFTSLLNNFPKLADSTDDLGKALSDIKTEKFTDFVENFADSLSDIDLTDKTALTNALSAFKMVLEDMNLSDIDMSKVSKQIYSSLTKSLTEDDAMTEDAASAIADSFTATLEEAAVAKTFSRAISDNSSAISTYQTKMNALISAQSDFKDSGKLSVDTISSLIDAGVDAKDIISGMSDGFSTLSNSLTDDFVQKYENIASQLDEADASVFTDYCEQIINSIKATTSAFDEWQTALSSSNQGANYDTIQGQLETMKSMYDEGWIGTDDFKTFAAMVDKYGVASIENFESSYAKASRYITEDKIGIGNLQNDLINKGLAHLDDNSTFIIDAQSYEQVANALGTSVDVVESAFGKLKETGADIWLASSVDEANQNISEINQSLNQSNAELALLKAQGADTSYIEEAQQKVVDYTSDLSKAQENVETIRMQNVEMAQTIDSAIKDIESNPSAYGYKSVEDAQGVISQLRSQMQEYLNNADMTYDEAMKINVTDVEVNNLQERIQSALEGENGGTVQAQIDTLSAYTPEQLSQINLTDGKYDTINGVDFTQAEQALDGLMETFGLTADQANVLIAAIQQLNSTEVEEKKLNGSNGGATNAPYASLTSGTPEEVEVTPKLALGELYTSQLSSDIAEAITQGSEQATLTPNVTPVTKSVNTAIEQASTSSEQATLEQEQVINVKTQIDNGELEQTAATISQMSDQEITEHFNVTGQESIEEIRNYANEISGKTIDMTVQLSDEQFTALSSTNKQLTVEADTSQAESAIDSLVGTERTIQVNVEANVTSAESSINGLTSSTPTLETPTIQSSVTQTVVTEVDSSAADSYQPADKTATVKFDKDSSIPDGYQPSDKTANVNYLLGSTPDYNPSDITRTLTYNIVTNGSVPSGSGGATGTLFTGKASPFVAHATGTAYNVLNLHPHAQGTDVGIKHNENALVNELGTEAIIRDGKLFEITGGTQFASLKKGDVVINAAQWEQIKRFGSIDSFAGKAYAYGTLSGINAYASGGHSKYFGNIASSSSSSSSSGSSSYSNYSNYTNAASTVSQAAQSVASSVSTASSTVSSSTKSTSKSTKLTMDKIKKYIEKLFDWVEVKIEYLTDKADNYYTKAENAIARGLNYSSNYKTARTNIQKSISTNEQLLTTNQKGEQVYSKQGTKVYNKYQKSKLSKKQKKQVKDAYQKLMNGEKIDLTISEYSENVRTAISNIQEWTDKMYECRYAVDDVTSTLIDQKEAFYNLPIDEAEAKVEKLEQALTSLDTAYTKLSEGKNISISAQNKHLDEDLKNQLSQLKEYQNAVKKTKADLDSAKNSQKSLTKSQTSAQNKVNSTKATVKTEGSSLLSNKKITKVLTSSQEKAVANGESITLTKKQKKKLSKSNKNLITSYNNAVKAASTASSKLSSVKSELSDSAMDFQLAQTAYDKALQTAEEAEQEYLEQQVENEKTKFENIQSYYKNRIDLLDKLNDLEHAGGQYEASSEYTASIKATNEELSKLKKQLNDSIGSGIIQVGSDEWFEMKSEIVETQTTVEELAKSQRKLRLEELFERAANSAQKFIDRLQTVNDLITDDMKFDLDGNLTKNGALSMMLDSQSLEKSKEKFTEYANERNRILTTEWKNKGYLGNYVEGVDSELDELLEDIDGKIQSEIKNIMSYQQSLLNTVIDANEKERDAILEVIDAQKEALSTKKDYYDYDKKLKEQNKEISSLRQQAAALSGSTSKDDLAKLRQIQAQLQEAEDDKKDTVQEHLYEMQTEALEQISEDITKYYEEMIATMKLTSENSTNAITQYLANNNINADNISTKIADVLKGYLMTDKNKDGKDDNSSKTSSTINKSGLNNNTSTNAQSTASKKKTDSFKSLVDNLGSNYGTSDMTTKINNAKSAYNSLSATEKSYVQDSYNTLNTVSDSHQKEITRQQNTVTSVKLSSSSLSVTVGKTSKLTCTVNPSTASKSNTVSWSSSNTSIATVSGGTVTGKKAGTATITATAGGKSATCKVTVKAAVTTSTTKNTTKKETASTQKQGNGVVEVGDKVVTKRKNSYAWSKSSGGKHVTKKEYKIGAVHYVGAYEKGKYAPILAYSDKNLKHKQGWIRLDSVKGYKTGSKEIDKDQLAWTQEEGSELIYRKSDGAMLTPLGRGDTVFSADKVQKLYKLLENDPVSVMNDAYKFSMPNVENVVNTSNISPVIECPITIMGNANEEEVKSAIRTMIPEINTSVQNSIRKDLRKAGRK